MSLGNTFGNLFRVTSFGESRGEALGVIIDGCPAGLELDIEDFENALFERKPVFSFETSRAEPDVPEILSGIFEGKTLGTPIAVLIKNKNTSEKNYENLKHIFRPGHADITWQAKYGFRDFRGGGRSSGRETVARVLAGAVAKKLLLSKNIHCCAFPFEVAGLKCKRDGTFTEEVLEKLQEIKTSGNSAGGIIECQITGAPAGLGEPVFSKLDAELAKAILSIGAVKGIEFGEGFNLAKMDGFTANKLDENYNGGILGGISTGEKIYFRVAVKPVPSISILQKALTDEGKTTTVKIQGQHDACLVRRICPVVEAMAELVLADFIILAKNNKFKKA